MTAGGGSLARRTGRPRNSRVAGLFRVPDLGGDREGIIRPELRGQ